MGKTGTRIVSSACVCVCVCVRARVCVCAKPEVGALPDSLHRMRVCRRLHIYYNDKWKMTSNVIQTKTI